MSTKDNQNPASSIPRQVALASARLDPGEEFVAYFWDVESGMLPVELRGLGSQEMYDALGVPVRRDGGLQDLVERASYHGYTRALAERSDRLARVMLTSLGVEGELEKLGVEVIYANEPTGGTESGRLRTRRYGQVEAELYRTVMMEMSMGGQYQHTLGGWNHGHPPYPYTTVVDENAPAAARNRFGIERPKRKLAPHPDQRRVEAARLLCRLRREEHLKGADIVAVLAAEPDLYPIEGHWTINRVEGLIANPKLTGYQVYNRKAKRTSRTGHSVLNPISEWVWSPEVAHEPIVSLEEWKKARLVTESLRSASLEEAGTLSRLRAAARRMGVTVNPITTSSSHTVYQIGTQTVVLPRPIPAPIVEQVIEDLMGAA
ncbi:recombinase family protein [Kitasatospora sp. NPDC096147]|uniref:recombinase family protein n=1 Tax=Kitasatospora sp. NPDC096147 TaxID=3364093 RepID=UPI0037FA0798